MVTQDSHSKHAEATFTSEFQMAQQNHDQEIATEQKKRKISKHMPKYYLVCWLFLSSLNSITKASRDKRGDPWLRHRRGWRRQAGTGRAGGVLEWLKIFSPGFGGCLLLDLVRGWGG